MIIDHFLYCRVVTPLPIFPLPPFPSLSVSEEGLERSAPFLRGQSLSRCHLQPAAAESLWGHLLLSPAAECLSSPALATSALTPAHCTSSPSGWKSLSVLEPWAGCLWQMVYPWYTKWGHVLPLATTSAYRPRLFPSPPLIPSFPSKFKSGSTSTKNPSLMF